MMRFAIVEYHHGGAYGIICLHEVGYSNNRWGNGSYWHVGTHVCPARNRIKKRP